MSHSAPPLDLVRRSPGRSPWAVARDYITLTKPSINRMCLITAAGGIALAPGSIGVWGVVWALLGTALAVGSANALNMWWERQPDRAMKRTQERPLAAGRISDGGALAFGVALGVLAAVILAAGTNAATTLVGLFALTSYVLVYTPLKYRSPLALVVGAIPGAAPPLMGYTAVTGAIDPVGLALFATLFAWQMPHFLAIAVFRRHDYAAAGIKTVTVVRGNRVAKVQALLWSVVLLGASVLLTPLGVTDALYAAVAVVLGLAMMAYAVLGFRATNDARWAYRYFALSLVYLPVLILALVLDLLAT
ncbi:MAG: heme o synthase [Myxococcales bacterium]|nr:heme o synthase [Myxococcales bacterium]MCB9734116.1 protoheme IX farnesyltransferase [Deltaproteobacteria bacterium]